MHQLRRERGKEEEKKNEKGGTVGKEGEGEEGREEEKGRGRNGKERGKEGEEGRGEEKGGWEGREGS